MREEPLITIGNPESCQNSEMGGSPIFHIAVSTLYRNALILLLRPEIVIFLIGRHFFNS